MTTPAVANIDPTQAQSMGTGVKVGNQIVGRRANGAQTVNVDNPVVTLETDKAHLNRAEAAKRDAEGKLGNKAPDPGLTNSRQGVKGLDLYAQRIAKFAPRHARTAMRNKAQQGATVTPTTKLSDKPSPTQTVSLGQAHPTVQAAKNTQLAQREQAAMRGGLRMLTAVATHVAGAAIAGPAGALIADAVSITPSSPTPRAPTPEQQLAMMQTQRRRQLNRSFQYA